MKRVVGEQLLEFIGKNNFPSFNDIRKAGIIKNFDSLNQALDFNVNQKNLAHLKSFHRFCVRPLPVHLLIIGLTWKKADNVIQHIKAQVPRVSFFKNEFLKIHKKSYISGNTKIVNARRTIVNLSEKTSTIKDASERCFLKAFVCFGLKGIIWDLEFRKLRHNANFTINKQKLLDGIFYQMIIFEDFFKNYDPKNPNYILGDSYDKVEELLDLIYFYDKQYYKSLITQENSLFEKISYSIDCDIKNSKKDASISHYAKKRNNSNFESRVREKWSKITATEIEEKFQKINGVLTQRMIAKKKGKDQKTKKIIAQKYRLLANKKREEIEKKVTEKNQKRCNKELSCCVPKNAKNITNMIKKIHDGNENPDLPKLLKDQTAQTNRLYFETVNDYLLRKFLSLYLSNYKNQRDNPNFKKQAKWIRKIFPDLVIP